MSQDMQPRIVPQVSALQHFSPPTTRQLRVQAVHRLQVGLFGLCAMLLLVSLANIIMDRARLAEEVDAPSGVVETIELPPKPAADPLADIGVVPAADPTAASGPVQAQ